MKKLLILVLGLFLLSGCERLTPDELKAIQEKRERWKGFEVIVIDSCEYLISSDKESYGTSGFGYGYFAHKGNCRFCEERRKNKKII